MKLLVIVLCLLSERFLIHTLSYQRFHWFDKYYMELCKRMEKNSFFANPWLQLAVIIIPLVFIVALVYFMFSSILFGLLAFILSVMIFLYCLGPQNVFYPPSTENATMSHDIMVRNYFSDANRQLFSVIFCYIIAGPIGALTYRLITLSQNIHSVSNQAKLLTDYIEWIPARLTSLLYLLVGNFQKGFPEFNKLLFTKPELNHQILSECGLQALGELEDTASLPAAEYLVEHATMVLIVLIALFTLASWI